jgi:hypothetical protein
MRNTRRRRLRSLRFRPVVAFSSDGAAILDRRLLPSADPASVAHASAYAAQVRPLARHARHSDAATKTSARTTPAEQIKKQYALFVANFQTVLNSYVAALTEQSTGTVPVSTTLTAPYLAGSASMQVADGSLFSTATPLAPVSASAVVGTTSVGTISVIGTSGNVLAINTAQSSLINLSTGTTLAANVPTSASSAAASIFPGYITSSTIQLAVNLVSYFNSVPFKLPRMFAFPHQNQRTGALQQYVYQVVASTGPDSLRTILLSVALPATPGGDLQIYQAAVTAAVDASESQMLSNVQQIFAGKLQVVPTSLVSSSSSSSGTASTSTTGSTSTSPTSSSAA